MSVHKLTRYRYAPKEGRGPLYRTQNEVASSGGIGLIETIRPRGFTPPPAAKTAGQKFGTQSVKLRREDPFSLVVDLGKNIGSRDWFRGAATCAALCYGAFSFAPGIGSIDGLSPRAFTANEWEEARALGIEPGTANNDSGRRMAPTDAVQPLTDAPERPSVELRAGLAQAGDVVGALTRSGVAQADANAAATLIATIVPLAEIPAGTVLELRLGRRGNPAEPRPLDGLAFRASFSLRVALARTDAGQLTIDRQAIAVDATPLRIQGQVGPSLYRSARAAGVPARIVEAYLRALATQDGMPGALTAADRFDIIIEHRRAATGEEEVGDLLYAGLARVGGRQIQMMRWTNASGNTQFFEASGVGRESSSGFRMPVPNGRFTSPFGNRMHPILRYVRMHTGVDIGAPTGSQIVAAAPGRVILAGWSGGYGRSVRIDHGGGITTVYGHMSGVSVQSGQSVAAGQLIGYVGSTGLSTGPHLHYEVRRGGVPVNPAGFSFVNRPQIAGTELDQFRTRMRALQAVPVGPRPMQTANAGFSALPESVAQVAPQVAQRAPAQPAPVVRQAPQQSRPAPQPRGGEQGVW